MKSLDLFETKAKTKFNSFYQCVDERTDSIPCNQYNRKLVPKNYLSEKAFQGGCKLKRGGEEERWSRLGCVELKQ